MIVIHKHLKMNLPTIYGSGHHYTISEWMSELNAIMNPNWIPALEKYFMIGIAILSTLYLVKNIGDYILGKGSFKEED